MNPETWFHERATHHVVAELLFHLNQVGVFHTLSDKEALSSAQLAENLNLSPGILNTCLHYLANVDPILCEPSPNCYQLTPFGAQTLQRFNRKDPTGMHYNLFDVRVGAYGPVWAKLSGLLKGEEIYGKTLERAGEKAAKGVYKVAAQLVGDLLNILDQQKIERLIEVGAPTGISAAVQLARPQIQTICLDRKQEALDEAQMHAESMGANKTQWLKGDLLNAEQWTTEIPESKARTALVSIHFHEFVVDGGKRVTVGLAALAKKLPGLNVIAFEHARLDSKDRSSVSETTWTYSHGNELIHHLIQNGRILSIDEWTGLFQNVSATNIQVHSLDFLGYSAFCFSL